MRWSSYFSSRLFFLSVLERSFRRTLERETGGYQHNFLLDFLSLFCLERKSEVVLKIAAGKVDRQQVEAQRILH